MNKTLNIYWHSYRMESIQLKNNKPLYKRRMLNKKPNANELGLNKKLNKKQNKKDLNKNLYCQVQVDQNIKNRKYLTTKICQNQTYLKLVLIVILQIHLLNIYQLKRLNSLIIQKLTKIFKIQVNMLLIIPKLDI